MLRNSTSCPLLGRLRAVLLALLFGSTFALAGACGDDSGQPAADQRPDRRLTDARPITRPVVDAFVPPDGVWVDAAVRDAGSDAALHDAAVAD